MSNKELRKTALKKLIGGSDMALISTLYLLTAVLFVSLTETGIYLLMKTSGAKDYEPFEPRYYLHSMPAMMFLILRLTVYTVILSTLMYLINRSFINFSSEDKTGGNVNRFISGHVRRLLLPSLKNNLRLALYKLLVASPLSLSCYGMSYYFRMGERGAIALWGLFIFMLSIGFTIIWSCMLARYYISLCLVPYIIELNPRADLFDACDLSVKLMEGNHMRVVGFMVSLTPLLIACLLVYPVLLIYPYITECRLLLARDIMGGYWQDKIPSMAKRWEKQMERLGRRPG